MYFGLSEFFCISSEETTKQILFMRSKFNFLYANECEFSFKYRYLKCWLCFCLFSDRKVISRHDFVAPKVSFIQVSFIHLFFTTLIWWSFKLKLNQDKSILIAVKWLILHPKAVLEVFPLWTNQKYFKTL